MGIFDHRDSKHATLGSFLGDIGRGAKRIGQAHINRAVGIKPPKPRGVGVINPNSMKQSLHARPPPILHSNGIVGHRVR